MCRECCALKFCLQASNGHVVGHHENRMLDYLGLGFDPVGLFWYSYATEDRVDKVKDLWGRKSTAGRRRESSVKQQAQSKITERKVVLRAGEKFCLVQIGSDFPETIHKLKCSHPSEFPREVAVLQAKVLSLCVSHIHTHTLGESRQKNAHFIKK